MTVYDSAETIDLKLADRLVLEGADGTITGLTISRGDIDQPLSVTFARFCSDRATSSKT